MTVQYRFETGLRHTDENGEVTFDNLGAYYSKWQDAYNHVRAVLKHARTDSPTVGAYIYDRMAHHGAEQCRYFDHAGDVIDQLYR